VKLSRRTLTKSAAASLMLSPFYNLLAPRKARAAATGPRRVLIFHNQPCDTRQWMPQNVTGESSFTLPEMLSNLAPLLPNVVLLDGLSPKQPGDNHFSPHAVTGVGREGRADKGIISIEQYIGDQLEKTPNKRPIKNLILGATAASESVFYRNSARLPTIASPMSAFNTVFSGGTPVPTPGKAPSQLLEQRKSMLDTLRGDVGELQRALGSSEKQKLELHLDSIRQFETRLASAKGGEAACTKPAVPTGDLSSVAKKTLADMAHLDLIVNAFACDITRLGAVQFGNSHTWQFDTPTGLRGELHMGIIHVQKIAAQIAIQNWLAAQFVAVCNKLKAIPEADGSGTLFDNTLVIWTRDFGDADGHNSKSMKFVVAQGDGGTYLKRNPKGRYFTVSGNNRMERILLNLAEFMGVNDFSGFGDISPDFKANKTPLSELRA
jgi:Protein of unknown function (DUF1552)